MKIIIENLVIEPNISNQYFTRSITISISQDSEKKNPISLQRREHYHVIVQFSSCSPFTATRIFVNLKKEPLSSHEYS